MKEKSFSAEAMRYIDNAKQILHKTTINGGFYDDEKYVKSAAGTAYAGLEKAARWYLLLRGYKQPVKDKSAIINGLNKVGAVKQKILFNEAYTLLHINAYYNDVRGVNTMKDGFSYAIQFIEKLGALKGNDTPELYL